jgi:hypothetical protein
VLTRSGDRRNRSDFEVNNAGGTLAVRLGCCRVAAACAVQQDGGAGVQGALGHAHRGDDLLYGGARGLPQAVARLAGPDGPRAGLQRRSGLGRASGSAQSGRVDFLFFRNIFSVQKQIQEMPRKCLEARKIPRKFRKFQENS